MKEALIGPKLGWLPALLALYALLTAIEITRVLMIHAPAESDIGVYRWELAPIGEEAGQEDFFRWTQEHSLLLRSVQSEVLTIPLRLSRPILPNSDNEVTIYVANQLLDRIPFDGSQRRFFRYYVPPVLGRVVRPQQAIPSLATDEKTARFERRWPPQLKELIPWANEAKESLRIRFRIADAFVPAQLAEVSDRRRLGIGLGQLEWTDQVPVAGLGFHPWESHPDGARSRWTSRLWASQPLEIRGREGVLSVHANNPDLESKPVGVEIYWNERLIHSISINGRDWMSVSLLADELGHAPGVLSLRVDRTWSPARTGVSVDTRELGIAVRDVEWR